MNKLLSGMAYMIPVLEGLALIAAIVFGTLWYAYPGQNWEPAFGLATLVFVLTEMGRRFGKPSIDPDKIAGFIEQGQQLRNRLDEEPLPIFEHNEWVEQMEKFLRKTAGESFAVRLSDFSGMTFYGDSSEKSKMSNSIEGRTRRLHEFLREQS